MTRKDYIAIATDLNRLWKTDQLTANQVWIVADQLIPTLKADNPNFQPQRFMDAVMKDLPELVEV